MAKDLRHMMKPWIEVAPKLLDFPMKISSAPSLETIKEDERAEEHDEDKED